jgi:hypothetical protein
MEAAKRSAPMKRLIWAIGGFCAAAAGMLVWGSKRTPRIEDLSDML